MAFISILEQVIKEGEPQVFVVFTDNLKYKTGEYFKLRGQTAESLRNQVEARRKELENSYTFIDTLDTNFDLTPTPVVSTPVVVPIVDKRMALSAALNDFNIKLIDQATYDQKVQDILNAK